MTLAELNALTPDRAAEALRACCGASRWVSAMVARRPFTSVDDVFAAADSEWKRMGPDDWHEAFSHHPRIGERAAGWAAGEQASVATAGSTVQEQLGDVNRAYEQKFGHIYIVCATGKSADELLSIARARLSNPPSAELRIAADEQRKITQLRLRKLLPRTLMSTISTHVLDTALGKPAAGVPVLLERVRDPKGNDAHELRGATIGAGTTDDDGRLKDFVSAGASLEPGTYRLRFDVADYFKASGREVFYPEVSVLFRVTSEGHYHIPLLLSPFGYSTYRGS